MTEIQRVAWREEADGGVLMDRNKQQELLDAIKRVANEKSTETLSRNEFSAATGISLRGIYDYFDGWRDACIQAGLKPHTGNLPIDRDSLLDEMRRVFLEQQKVCTKNKFSKSAKFSIGTYDKWFGRWDAALATFRDWVIENNLEFPYMDALPTGVPDSTVANGADNTSAARTTYLVPTQSGRGSTYGAFLNFRGLQHAPVNEQGVVFLFGMVCHELGFVVELVRTGFPDCEAKRCTHTRRDTWERVRIEFEFKAANAKVHPMSGCDLIVCWENNWPDCPVEVLELKTAIRVLNRELGASSI